MAVQTEIRLANLLVDAENPRLPLPNLGQREVFQAIAKSQGKKLQSLATDIVEYGLNPSELSIVMPLEDETNRYVVLEGNRRLTALRGLESPDLLEGASPAGVVTAFRTLSQEYRLEPIDTINCLVVANREEAQHWIELRHDGEMEGAGIVRWGSQEKSRFRKRSGSQEVHLQALEFLVTMGYLTPETRRGVPATSFKRLLGTPAVRTKLGIETAGGRLTLLAGESEVAKALFYVAEDLSSGRTKVADIYTREKRLLYAANLPAEIVVARTLESGEGTEVATDGGPKEAGTRPTRPRRRRNKLIPDDCPLNVIDERIRNIETELRRLSIEDYPNACSVLLRVFIELSVDAYIEKETIEIPDGMKLRGKLQSVITHLLARQKLTSLQARPVRRALQGDSFLSPSITMMNEFVHNFYMSPSPTDLRASWDNLQSFVTAIWAP